jgi:hypothetical protein
VLIIGLTVGIVWGAGIATLLVGSQICDLERDLQETLDALDRLVMAVDVDDELALISARNHALRVLGRRT